MIAWMLYAILFGAIATLGASAVAHGARSLRRPTRFVWLAALVVAVAGPLVLPILPMSSGASGGGVTVGAARAVIGHALSSPLEPSAAAAISSALASFNRLALAGWVLLSLWCFAKLARSVARLRRSERQWVARRINDTPVYVTSDLGPAVLALPSPRIVVPEWALSLDTATLATVIRHERQHEAAGDAWLVIAGSIAEVFAPWNPAVRFIRRRLRLALEMDCDARVLAEDPRVDRYGSLLIAIAQHPRLTPAFGAMLSESTSDLERRIDAMIAPSPRFPRIRAAALAAAGMMAIAVACAMPSPDFKEQDAKAAEAPGQFFDFQVTHPASARPSNMPPKYPAQLRAAGIEGTVIAKFVVDTNGSVIPRTFEVIRSDHDGFTAAVREAIPTIKFFPATVGERKVKQLVSMPFAFALAK